MVDKIIVYEMEIVPEKDLSTLLQFYFCKTHMDCWKPVYTVKLFKYTAHLNM